MKNIWDEGVSNTISFGTVKLFHSPKFYVEHYITYEWCKNEFYVLRKGQ